MTAVNRRELVRMGGSSLAGWSLSRLMAAEAMAAPAAVDASFGRARNIIYLYLNGGPSQHETFDPKPDAPAEIRGPFKPIQTNIPGIQFCELLPRTAALADKLAVVRSMATVIATIADAAGNECRLASILRFHQLVLKVFLVVEPGPNHAISR